MNTTSRWIAAGAALLLAAAAAGWWLVRGDARAATYRTAPIERGALQAAVSAAGTVTPVSQVQVSSQVSGQILERFVDFNSEVKKGQLIARLDPQIFEYRVRQTGADVDAARATVLSAQANVAQALAQLSRAQLEQSEAQRDFERKQGLVAQGFISPAELDIARSRMATLAEASKAVQAQVQAARAQAQNADAVVRQRQAQLEQARVDLQRTEIRSPVDGIVIKRSVEVGQTVAASLQAPELFVIARNLRDMQVEVAIDEADIARVRAGQPASFTIDAFAGRPFDGEVSQVRQAALATQNVVTYTVVVSFANPDGRLLPGMTANVRIVTDQRQDVLKVPNAALRVRIAGVEPASAAPRTAPTDAVAPPADAASAAGAAGVNGGRRAQGGEPPTAEQRARYRAQAGAQGGRAAARGRLYLLAADGRPRALDVRLGISDGSFTELLPSPGGPQEGDAVVTAVVAADAQRSAAPAPRGGPRAPF